MTIHETKEALRLLFAAFPAQRQRMNDDDVAAMLAAYAAGFADLDANAIKPAITRVLRTSKFLPTIAEIREAVGTVENGAARVGAEAWGDVKKAIGRHGSRKTPGHDFHFDDPLVARLVDSFGWRDLCLSEESTADRARFVDAYNATAATQRREAQASPGATLPSPSNAQLRAAGELVAGLAKTLTGGR